MSFDYDQDSLKEHEAWWRDDRTSQGGIYGIFVDGVCVYIGKTSKGKSSCLAHRIAQHWCGIFGEYTTSKGGLNLYDCLSYWKHKGLYIEFLYKTLDELTSDECRDCIDQLYRSAYDKDPLGIAEALMIIKYDPVLNTRKPTAFKPCMNRFWDDDFDIKQQLRDSSIDWIAAAADITPRYF